MTKQTKFVPIKGLPFATKTVNHFLKCITSLDKWSNSPLMNARSLKIFAIYTLRLFHLRFSDLKISEFKSISTRSDKNYVLVLLMLYIDGKATKTTIFKRLGIGGEQNRTIIKQFIEAGYIREALSNKVIYIGGQRKIQDMKHLELTSKGYDKINFIFSLLIDQRLLQ